MNRKPNWWDPLMRAAEAHGLDKTSAVAHAEILHDDECDRLEGVGVCNCNPDVRLTSRDRRAAGEGES